MTLNLKIQYAEENTTNTFYIKSATSIDADFGVIFIVYDNSLRGKLH